jgi:hypothetical protein
VTLHAGSLEDSGSAILTASADGSWETRFSFSKHGQRTSSRAATEGQRSCQWSDSDGTAHDSNGNCWAALVWFLPQISLQPGLIAPAITTSDLGAMASATGAKYVIQNQIAPSRKDASAAASPLIQYQSTTRLSLDPASMLPQKLNFFELSDSGKQQISVEVRFSRFQSFSGLIIPTHIERYLNGGLELSIDVAQAVILN